MAFAVGARVRRINNPSDVGWARASTLERGQREYQEIEFEGAGVSLCLVETLELCPERSSHIDDFERGRFAGPADLAAVITLEKLRGELTDLLYSMGAGKTDFYPHPRRSRQAAGSQCRDGRLRAHRPDRHRRGALRGRAASAIHRQRAGSLGRLSNQIAG